MAVIFVPKPKLENVHLRITPEDKVLLFKLADDVGISASAFLRLLLYNYANGITFKKEMGMQEYNLPKE